MPVPAGSAATVGIWPSMTSSRVTCSRTFRRLARTAIHTNCRCSAEPRYSIASGRSPRTRCQGAVQSSHDLGHADVVRGAGEPVAAVMPALIADDARPPQVVQDRTQKPGGQVLVTGERSSRHRFVAGGQHEKGA